MKIRRAASARAARNERNRRSNKRNGAREGEEPAVLFPQQVQIVSRYRWRGPLRHGALRDRRARPRACARGAFALKFIGAPGRSGAPINVILCERARYRCIAKYQLGRSVIFYASGGHRMR